MNCLKSCWKEGSQSANAPQTRDSTSCGVMIAPAAAPSIASAPREMVGIGCAVGQVRRDDFRRRGHMFRAKRSAREGGRRGPSVTAGEGSSNVPAANFSIARRPGRKNLRYVDAQGRTASCLGVSVIFIWRLRRWGSASEWGLVDVTWPITVRAAAIRSSQRWAVSSEGRARSATAGRPRPRRRHDSAGQRFDSDPKQRRPSIAATCWDQSHASFPPFTSLRPTAC